MVYHDLSARMCFACTSSTCAAMRRGPRSVKNCTICYNKSVNTSSQEVLSAEPSPRLPFHHPIVSRLGGAFTPLFVFIRSLEGDQPCRLPYLDGIRCSLLLRQDRIKLIRSKKICLKM